MRKIILLYGIIAGAIPAGMFYLNNSHENMTPESMQTGMIIGYLSMLVGFITIFFAIRQYRDKVLQAPISFGKAFLVGLYITLIASVIYATSWEIYQAASDSNFAEAYLEYQHTVLVDEGKSPEEIETFMAEQEVWWDMYQNNIFVRFGLTMTEILPVGLIVSLICALLFSFILKPNDDASAAVQ